MPKLDEIKTRRERITQGGWVFEKQPSIHFDCPNLKHIAICGYVKKEFSSNEITDFIANAPTDIDWLIAEVERLRLKCGEASPEGVLISDYSDQAKCPHCGGYNPDYWDNPASTPEAEFPDFEVLVRCYECDGLYYAQRHEISFITSTKTKTEQRNPARDITDAEIFQAISDFLAEVKSLKTEKESMASVSTYKARVGWRHNHL